MATTDNTAAAQALNWIRNHYFGKYRGTVVSTLDPNAQGRVQVEVPAVLGEVRLWAMPCVPYAGDGVGFYALPEEGTGIWVEFEGGDPSFPIWTGCFWGTGQLPDQSLADIKVLRTGSHTIRLDDALGELLIASDDGGQTAYTSEVATTAGMATHTVSPTAVSASKGMGSMEISDSGTTIDGSALEVK